MSGVLHPVGPEPEETYWVRRAMVLGAALLLGILAVALWVNSTSTGTAAAPPPAPPATEAAAQPAVSPTPDPSASPTPSDSASPTPSDSASPSDTASPSASDTAATPAEESATPSPTPTSSPKPEPKPAGPTTCDPDDLRTTLTGDQRLKPEQATTFKLSLINGSGKTCSVEVSRETFGVTIYSGTDRIWTTSHCATAVKPIEKTLAAEEAVAWTLRWDGRRSAPGCADRPEIPRPGTYVVTALLKGSDPVRLGLQLQD